MHDRENKVNFDTVCIITDRIVVDRQLQNAVLSLEHKAGLIKVMDEKCTSKDLADALNGNTKIIVTTIHKFMYIQELVQELKSKTFAVIIDEAHSSTAGTAMESVTYVLSESRKLSEATPVDVSEEEKSMGRYHRRRDCPQRKAAQCFHYCFYRNPEADHLAAIRLPE